MKKDDIEAIDKDIDPKKITSYFDAIHIGDIDALIEIEKTVDNVKGLFKYLGYTFTTAIEFAAHCGHNHVIEHFINLGAELDVTAMIAAINGGQIDTMVYLNQGVPEKQRIAFNIRFEFILLGKEFQDFTLMHFAASVDQINVMIFLNNDPRVSASERIPYNVKTQCEITPMHMAAGKGKIDAMIFLNKDCRVSLLQRTPYSVQDKCGLSPIHLAAMNGHNNAVIFLAEDRRVSDPTPYVSTRTGMTLMHWAAIGGQIDTMKLLATKGIRYDVKSKRGDTLMHHAAYAGKLNIIEFLYSNSAVPPDQRTSCDVKSKTGKTPLDRAIARGHTHVVDFLNKVLKSSPSNESTNVISSLPITQSESLFRDPKQNIINEIERNALTAQPLQAFAGSQFNVPLQNNNHIVSPPKMSSPYDEILRKLNEHEAKMNMLLNQQKNPQNFSNQGEIKNQSPSTKNRNNNPKSSTEKNSNHKRPVPRDKAKPTSPVVENNKKQKTACTTTDTVEALKGQVFLRQERKNDHQDQEIIYAGDRPHPLGGQSLDNLARMAKIKTEHPDEENEVDSVMKY